MKKLISIVIPVCNGSKYIHDCISSILNQKVSNYELILVDNNSTDNSKEIIMEYCKKDKRIKYTFENKHSRGAARNKGIKKSIGSIIVMTDIDCILPNNWIKTLIKPILEENESVVVGFEKEKNKNYWNISMIKANKFHLKRVRYGKYINHIDTKNFAIRAEIIKKNNFNTNLRSMEDYELYLRLNKKIKIRYLPQLKVVHNHNYNLFEIIKTNFLRGYWTTNIYYNYKIDKNSNELMTEWIKQNNFLKIFSYFIKRIIKSKTKLFFVVSNIGWLLGVNCFKINKILKNT